MVGLNFRLRLEKSFSLATKARVWEGFLDREAEIASS